MTQKEKKEYAILGVLVVATLAVIYFNFFKPKSSPIPEGPISAIPGGAVTPSLGAGLPVTSTPGATPTAATAASGPFLPNGPALDLKVLDDSRFKSLTPPVYPQVTLPEIGSTNPFGE